MVNFIAPIRQRADDILQNKAYLKEVMLKGAAAARESAAATMAAVRQAMGLNYY